MPTYAVFLRAVNVGTRRVTMQRVAEVLSDNGFRDVVTHINSGNVRVTTGVRSASAVGSKVGRLLSDEFGFDIPCLARTTADLLAVAARVDATPSPLGDRARTYVCFLDAEAPEAAVADLGRWDVDGERALVLGAHVVIWLTGPSHEARLSNARVEKITGSVSTMRDVKVVRALAQKWGP
ncbi:MAG: DUF1697 domain-containing protein [Actinomycetota bacterium]|nr:DUF1697 domain-containing protein [Actinomycetota bacterium]